MTALHPGLANDTFSNDTFTNDTFSNLDDSLPRPSHRNRNRSRTTGPSAPYFLVGVSSLLAPASSGAWRSMKLLGGTGYQRYKGTTRLSAQPTARQTANGGQQGKRPASCPQTERDSCQTKYIKSTWTYRVSDQTMRLRMG